MSTLKNCSHRNHHIYLMDDDDPVYSSMSLLLSKQGIQLALFRSLDHLIEGIKQHTPDCLLIEYNLQPNNGLAVYQFLKQQGILLPTIFLSTYSDINTAVTVMRAGALDFIEKPFTETRLITSINQVLDAGQLNKN